MIIAASFKLNDQAMLNNRGLQYGDGLFETMRMHLGEIPLYHLHMDRLRRGLEKLDLSPIDPVELLSKIKLNCPPEKSSSCVIKLVVFRAAQKRGYCPATRSSEWFVTVSALNELNNQDSLRLAVAKHTLSIQPMLAGLKHLSRLEQVMLAAELKKHDGVDDLLVLNTKRHVIETTYQNVIFVKGDALVTPKLNQCGVKGVALKWLKSKYKVKKKVIRINEITAFDGLMLCNSIRGFRPVSLVDGKPLKDVISFGKSLPIQDKISKQWEAQFNS